MPETGTQAPSDTAAELRAALGEDKPDTSQAPSPEETSAPAQETVTEPEYFSENFDPSTLSENEQKAYASMRKAFTQKTQELAEQRKQTQWQQDLITDLQSDDPEAKSNALKWMAENGLLTEEQTAQVFGWEFEQGEGEEQAETDPTEQMRSEWEQFKAEREQAAQQAQQDALVARVDADAGEQLTKIAQDMGVKELPQRTQELLVSRALVAHVKPDGMLDVHAAFKELEEEWTERQRGWASSKETTSIQPGGEAATEVPDLANERDRRDHMAAQIAALSERQGLQ